MSGQSLEWMLCVSSPGDALKRPDNALQKMNKTIVLGLVTALIAALIALGAWYHAHEALAEARTRLISGELQPIAGMLNENQALIRELRAAPFTEQDAGILEAYLAKIRRDGVPKHADMRQRLDELAENNTTIVALIKAYSAHAKTPVFTT